MTTTEQPLTAEACIITLGAAMREAYIVHDPTNTWIVGYVCRTLGAADFTLTTGGGQTLLRTAPTVADGVVALVEHHEWSTK